MVARTLLSNSGHHRTYRIWLREDMVHDSELSHHKRVLRRRHASQTFYFDPNYVTPLNIATRDTDESVVLRILEHDFRNTMDKRWFGDDTPHTWEGHATLKNVEAFHQYCATHQLNTFLPKDHPEFWVAVRRQNQARSGEHRSNSLSPWNLKTSLLAKSYPSEKEEDPQKIRFWSEKHR